MKTTIKLAEVDTNITYRNRYVLYKKFDSYKEYIPISISTIPASLYEPCSGFENMFFIPNIDVDPIDDHPLVTVKETNLQYKKELSNNSLAILLMCELFVLQIARYKAILEKDNQFDGDIYCIIYFDFEDQINEKTRGLYFIYAIHDKKMCKKVLKYFRKRYGYGNLKMIKYNIKNPL